MTAALEARNELVHSVALTKVDDDGHMISTFWHPKSDREDQ